jgi:hypothetical protein
MHTETGHIVFNLEKRGKEFIEEFFNYYVSGDAFKEIRWDDCWIFDKTLERTNVSNGALSTKLGAPYDFEAIVDHNLGNWWKLRDSRKGI